MMTVVVVVMVIQLLCLCISSFRCIYSNSMIVVVMMHMDDYSGSNDGDNCSDGDTLLCLYSYIVFHLSDVFWQLCAWTTGSVFTQPIK